MNMANNKTTLLFLHLIAQFAQRGANRNAESVLLPIIIPVCVADKPSNLRYNVKNGMRHILVAAKKKVEDITEEDGLRKVDWFCCIHCSHDVNVCSIINSVE